MDIKRRILMARNKFSKLEKCMCRSVLELKTRLRILNFYMWSTLLYGVETWTLTHRRKLSLQTNAKNRMEGENSKRRRVGKTSDIVNKIKLQN